ncbi:MAG: carbon storage regulator [Ruminococcaceae bacterium]|jgi:carbon storage regulator|nr:carbon storage regulator [Oscillospiraceae bacterium]
MLILRRRAGETILIGEDVKITVMDVYEGGVRLAIDAPKSIPVLRSELLLAAKANQDAAAKETERPDELLGLLGSVPEDKKQKL